ncbi:Zn(II)2Cys6 transcription factor [Geopyxis carbonaria]|nr:Zn(II)2Cys6 transcription factor [Geopyxis carbonaria]
MSRVAAGGVPAGSVPIAKLPTARRYTSEARENMNCKSCRKRKIKCSRTRPSCNACDVFRCECVYDAVPKKRGPKTEVLEELLKRIDGLEKRLGENEGGGPTPQTNGSVNGSITTKTSPVSSVGNGREGSELREVQALAMRKTDEVASSPSMSVVSSNTPNATPIMAHAVSTDDPTVKRRLISRLIDVFFERVNGKPYTFFHEEAFRDDMIQDRVPNHILNSVCAVSVRYAPTQDLGNKSPQEHGEEFAALARSQVDSDEPTLDNLQSLLLLSMTYYAMGYGKKSFMQMGSAIRMTLALDLHRELPAHHMATPLEREIRRRVFWTCYQMDRFTVCGSVRPPCFSDRSIYLRLPCSEESFRAGVPADAPLFSETGQGYGISGTIVNSNLLVDVVRILGRTIRYTQSGGVKGDSHFPWHTNSNLSRIRNELNAWASARDLRDGVPPTPDATSLFLARCTWHVIHCLMYRNFLPIDLAELDGNGTQQAWQMEATKVCFQHANALVDLIAVAAMTPAIEWPAFAGFCLATAASVLVHGVFYKGSEAFRKCRENLLVVLKQIGILRNTWACMKQQLFTLQKLYRCHEKLVESYSPANRPASVFHLDDFFERYVNDGFEASHVPFFDTHEAELDLTFIESPAPTTTPYIHSPPPYPNVTPPAAPPPTTQPHTAPTTGFVDDGYTFDSPAPHDMTFLSGVPPFGTHGGLFDFDTLNGSNGYLNGQTGDGMYGNKEGSPDGDMAMQEERDPLLNMLAEMAERDGDPAPVAGDVWMAN